MPRRVRAGDVELRRLDVADAQAMVEAMTASLPKLAVWFAWARSDPRLDDQVQRAHDATVAFDAGTDYEFSIFEVASSELVGGLRVNPLVEPGVAELGYWIRSDRHRRGYSTEAVAAVTTAVFANLAEVASVEIRMDVENRSSRGVAAAAGFVLDREIDRPVVAPGHTGRAQVWRTRRPQRPSCGSACCVPSRARAVLVSAATFR